MGEGGRVSGEREGEKWGKGGKWGREGGLVGEGG